MTKIKIMEDLKVLYPCKFQRKNQNKMKKSLKRNQIKIFFSNNPVTFIENIRSLRNY